MIARDGIGRPGKGKKEMTETKRTLHKPLRPTQHRLATTKSTGAQQRVAQTGRGKGTQMPWLRPTEKKKERKEQPTVVGASIEIHMHVLMYLRTLPPVTPHPYGQVNPFSSPEPDCRKQKMVFERRRKRTCLSTKKETRETRANK